MRIHKEFDHNMHFFRLVGVNEVTNLLSLMHEKAHRHSVLSTVHTEVRFSSFFSGGFITAIVVNPPERKRTSVQYMAVKFVYSEKATYSTYSQVPIKRVGPNKRVGWKI